MEVSKIRKASKRQEHTVESASEGIEGDDDDDAGDPAGEGSPNACLGLDGRARERSSSRVRRKESANGV